MSDQGLEEIRAARDELDAVIEEIRAVPGFEDFLAPPTFADVAAAAAPTPIVYLTAAEPGGVALVVRGEEVRSLELAALTAGALAEHVRRHLDIYAAYREDPEANRARWTDSLDDVCQWLWGAVMESVMADLAGSAAATLVAGGLLGLLPLHAAWTPDDAAPTGRLYALDAMPLTYAPNARALRAARALAGETTRRRLLAVVEPRPVTGAPLPWASLEGEVAKAALPEGPVTRAGGTATKGNFVRGVLEAEVLHLACHGFADLAAPLDSGLQLAGNRNITLHELMPMPLNVRLAVLSACETSLPGTQLPDEVVALPTGLLQAGVAGVVASLWAVPDRPTAMLMADFYRRWRKADSRPGLALRDAQQWLRDSTNEEKREAWLAAAAEPWFPQHVADEFIRALNYRDPDARDDAAIRGWGAFTHVGA